jgi:hypothetical protein
MTALSVFVAGLAAFVFSAIWYAVFGKARMALLAQNQAATADVRHVPATQILFEAVRSLAVAIVIAHLVTEVGAHGWMDGELEVGLWLAVFPGFILAGSVLWDKRPWQLAAIHGGDWLFKIALVTGILSAWPT